MAAADMNFGSPEEAHAFLLEHIDEPWVHESVARTTRAILDAPDEAAFPYLARLLAWQFTDRTVPDRRARHALALLRNADGGVVQAVAHLATQVLQHLPDGVPVGFVVLNLGVETRSASLVTDTERGTETVASWTAHPDYRLAFDLLMRHGLASGDVAGRGVSGHLDPGGGPRNVRVRRDDAAFLERLLRVETVK